MTRPEVSSKNQYYISKHRYYELKHFCLQYPIWIEVLKSINYFPNLSLNLIYEKTQGDPTAKLFEKSERYLRFIKILEDTARETDPELHEYILRGATSGVSFDVLRAKTGIPCCRERYYELYRRFFFILDKNRESH